VTLPVAGSKVRLRDLTIDDADLLDAWAADPDARGGFNDFGLEPSRVDRGRWRVDRSATSATVH
jgi:hypothetical protein